MPRALSSCLALLAGGSLLAGCGPADGIQSYAFALASPSSLALPTAQDTDLRLDGVAYAAAQGKVTGTPGSHVVTVVIEGLPPLGVASEKAHYGVVLTVAAAPIPPQQASLGGRILEALSPVSIAWADEDTEVELPPLDTDRTGRATLTVDEGTVRTDAVESARVDLVLPIDAANAKRFKVLEGMVGNLPTPGATSTTPATGHHH